jgi:hypothetical protein
MAVEGKSVKKYYSGRFDEIGSYPPPFSWK